MKATAGVGGGSGGAEDAPGTGKPKPGTAYSGRFLVRMPSDLHEQLVQAAARENVSLNRFVTGVLSESVTESATDAAPEAGPPSARSEDAPAAAQAAPAEAPGHSRNSGRTLRMVVAANVVVVVLAAAVAVVLLVLALQRGL